MHMQLHAQKYVPDVIESTSNKRSAAERNRDPRAEFSGFATKIL